MDLSRPNNGFSCKKHIIVRCAFSLSTGYKKDASESVDIVVMIKERVWSANWLQTLPGGRSGIIGLGKRKTRAAIRILPLSTGNKKDAMRFCCGN